jgi:heat shock protein HtpX
VNVYDHIASNTRRTVLILCAFPIALFVVLYLFCGFLVGLDPSLTWRMGILVRGTWSAGFDLALKCYPWIILVVSLWIVFSCFGGDGMILGAAHARPVTREEHLELFRLVENTAIMAGLPTPKIYLIDDPSLNAFATGRTPQTASIALTEGIVEKLDRLELQAVIAHELGHIGNRDTRLMLITIAGIGCFIFLGEMLLRMACSRSRNKDSDKGGGIFLIAALGCLVFGYLVAPLLRFALSRRREYQADATAARITHDPGSLARALSKIVQDPRVEVLDSSPLVGNLCIANPADQNGFLSFVSHLYATHPPVIDRIQTLQKMIDARD